MENRSLEQLENNYWKEPLEFPTDLVEKCYRFRKISIAKLTNEQLRVLISQNIGLEYIIKIALDKLQENILTEGDLYEGDLLNAVSRLSADFWNKKPEEFLRFKQLVEFNSEKIKAELSEKDFDKIKERIKASA